jgi:Holliday junction resolvase-like predicted endonuclease
MSDAVEIRVKKNHGDYDLFDEEKLRNALRRSGASHSETIAIIEQLRPKLFDGITTKKIYQIAYGLLRKYSHRAAGRYRLKKAIMELGPTGYPFEKFVGKLFEADGYKAVTGVQLQGKCVGHEVDVVATKGNKKYMVECKFHSDTRKKSDVKVALYIQSRFLDVSAKWKEEDNNPQLVYKGMVVTNTRFSEDAMQFGKCAGLKVVSWDYPQGNSLKDWIDRSGYHPVTSLNSLRKKEKQILLEEGIVLCRQLGKDFSPLNRLHLSNTRIRKIKQETLDLIS